VRDRDKDEEEEPNTGEEAKTWSKTRRKNSDVKEEVIDQRRRIVHASQTGGDLSESMNPRPTMHESITVDMGRFN
jgi:hypothetical protein